jgi:hypothetical protein
MQRRRGSAAAARIGIAVVELEGGSILARAQRGRPEVGVTGCDVKLMVLVYAANVRDRRRHIVACVFGRSSIGAADALRRAKRARGAAGRREDELGRCKGGRGVGAQHWRCSGAQCCETGLRRHVRLTS